MKTIILIITLFAATSLLAQDRKVEIEPIQILNRTAVSIQFDNTINYIDADSTIGFGVIFLDSTSSVVYEYGNTYKFDVNKKATLEDMKQIILDKFGVTYK